jgi:hypothetical protein
MMHATKTTVLVAITAAALIFAVSLIYLLVDIIATLEDLWTGNPLSVAVATAMHDSGAALLRMMDAYVVPLVKAAGIEFYAGWLALFNWLGFSELVAAIVLVMILTFADVAFLAVLIIRQVKLFRRDLKKMSH